MRYTEPRTTKSDSRLHSYDDGANKRRMYSPVHFFACIVMIVAGHIGDYVVGNSGLLLYLCSCNIESEFSDIASFAHVPTASVHHSVAASGA